MAYDKKFRKQAIAYKDGGHTFKELEEVFGIDSGRYYRWKELLETTGSLEDKKVCERKRKIDKDELKKALEEKPDIYLYELAKLFDCTVQAVFYALRKMKITYKKRRSLIPKSP
jgi:transposase